MSEVPGPGAGERSHLEYHQPASQLSCGEQSHHGLQRRAHPDLPPVGQSGQSGIHKFLEWFHPGGSVGHESAAGSEGSGTQERCGREKPEEAQESDPVAE